MKSWLLLLLVVAAAALVLLTRRSVRTSVVTWMAARVGPDARSGRRAALLWHGSAFLAAVATLTGAWFGVRAGGAARWVGDAAAIAVVLGYLPFTSLGAPKMTRWQKSFGQHLAEAGAARSAATACADVARVFSVVGVLVALAALVVVSGRGA